VTDIIILDLPPWCALEINALQQASTLVIQKSLREGFGLTVPEALWKGKPTIAGAAGGIPNQIIPKLTGVLVRSWRDAPSRYAICLPILNLPAASA
jgi:trehalose synthase